MDTATVQPCTCRGLSGCAVQFRAVTRTAESMSSPLSILTSVQLYFDDFQNAFFLPQETDSGSVEGNIDQHAPPAVLYTPLRLELAPHIRLEGLLNG